MFNFFLKKLNNVFKDGNFSEIFRGSVWALSSRILIAFLGLAAHILIARFYGAEVMGIVAVVNSFLLIASIFTVCGTDTSIMRFIPEHIVKYSTTSAYRIYRKILMMVASMALVTATIFLCASDWVSLNVFSKPQFSFFLYTASFFIVFKSLMTYTTAAARGLRMIRLYVFLQLLPSIANLTVLILLVVIVNSREDPVYARLAAVFMTGITGWLVMEFAFKKKKHSNQKTHTVAVRKILTTSLPMFMTSAMGLVIGQIGVLMIGAFRSEAEVGYFAVAVKLATLTSFVNGAIDTNAAPKFSELFHLKQYEDLFRVAKKSAKLAFWTTLPILLALFLLGPLLLKYVFGREFISAYPTMAILLAGQLVNSMAGSSGHFLNMTGQQKILGYILFTGAMANVMLNWMLIPIYGIIGSAIASVGANVLWNTSALLYIRKKYGATTGYFPFARRKKRK